MEKAWLVAQKAKKEEFFGKECRKCHATFGRPYASLLGEFCPKCGGKLKTLNRPALPEMNPWQKVYRGVSVVSDPARPFRKGKS
jgi:hypothetical protein